MHQGFHVSCNSKGFKYVTYSVDSICSEDGMIIIRQFKRIVKIMISENNGWTKMCMATRRTGLNGDKNHMASEAENLKKDQ